MVFVGYQYVKGNAQSRNNPIGMKGAIDVYC